MKFNVPGDDVYHEFLDTLQKAKETHRHFIIDRMHLSNFAYNGLLGGSILMPDEWSRIDALVAEQQAFLYWMVDTPQAVQERLQMRQGRDDGAERLDRPWLAMIHGRFDSAFRRSVIPHKGSFTLPQFVDDGVTTAKYNEHLLLIRAVMAGVAC